MKSMKRCLLLVLAAMLCISCLCLTALADEGEPVPVLVKSIKLDQTKATLNVGDTLDLNAAIAPENADNPRVVWESSNEKVATVDSRGKVTAVNGGTADIVVKATDGSGKSAKCTVKVLKLRAKETSFTVSKMNPDVISMDYYGSDESTLNFALSGKAFGYSREILSAKQKIEFEIVPLRAGTGTITVTDKSDGTKVTLTITIEDSALKNNKRLLVTGVTFSKKGSYCYTTVKLENTGSQDILAYGIRVDYLDSNDNVEKMYVAEKGDWNFSKYENCDDLHMLVSGTKAAPGKAVSVSDSFYCGYYPSFRPTHIKAAVAWYEQADGTVVYMPDNQQSWFDSNMSNYGFEPYVDEKNQYTGIGADMQEKADSWILGYNSVPVYKNQCKAWNLNHAGELLTVVKGQADNIGLEQYDVVWAVNGVKYEDDPLMMERAKAILRDGGKVVFSVERCGEDIEITAQLNTMKWADPKH